MEIKDAIRIIENTAGFDDDTTGVGEAWKEILRYINDAIPRSRVQAAVNEIDAGILRAETNACNGSCADFADGAIAAYRDALDELRNHTGVVPTEEDNEDEKEA